MSEIIYRPAILSGYLGSEVFGGEFCQELEARWEAKFNSPSVAVNSATSGLLAACMAVGVRPGDEVIIPPYTMSATAAVPVVLGANIVFADIDPQTFTLDPEQVARRINQKTKAVIVTNLFGQPGYLHQLRALCDGAGIVLIEDNSQSILATEMGVYAGTIGHIGVFSLNVHKHIQTGEGGVVVTNDGEFEIRLRGAMNHGEMRGLMAGLNLRMTEITAAMAIEELNRVDAAVGETRALAKELKHIINNSKDVWYYPQREDCEHSYYCLPVSCRNDEASRKLSDLGIDHYMEPLTEVPAFQIGMQPYSLPIAYEISAIVRTIELVRNPRIEEIKKALEDM